MTTFKFSDNKDETFKVDGITPSTVYYSSLLTGIEYEMEKSKFDRLRKGDQIKTGKV